MRNNDDGSNYDRGFFGGHTDSDAARRGKEDREYQDRLLRSQLADADRYNREMLEINKKQRGIRHVRKKNLGLFWLIIAIIAFGYFSERNNESQNNEQNSIHPAHEKTKRATQMYSGGLLEYQVYDMYLGVVGSPPPSAGQDRVQYMSVFNQVAAAGQKIVNCVYRAENNKLSVYQFWYKKAPSQVSALIAIYPNSSAKYLGYDAVNACPSNSDEALRVRQISMRLRSG
ncbi:hypothetical protein LPB260_16360 [Pseudomonas sp. LPB0260]|uniref:hypothetical protein n=1 Tax=Pseudomonas sp. LPB0260 TaxID=2614442 RepID=UPI0015C27A1A|nr:hypothetical protein [Pseudomonas sp. LPB0260]QLC72353.1 hypothetical protein LPB260_01410 [Pseudomonas sp. LPB0260]QLC75130.1 hypothetical protein LPB260_16360 [Pseudomonas sp. LPB0260]